MIDTILVRVIDLYTQTPIENAFLKSSISFTYTDSLGFGKIIIKNNDRKIYVSHLNYQEKTVVIPNEIKEITISLEYKEISLSEVVVSSPYSFSDEPKSIIKKFDIYITPGSANDVFWTLKDLPSISGNNDVGLLEVRGGNYNETSIFINNSRIINPFISQTPAGGLFSFIKTDFIKKVDFFPGGMPANLGGSISGAVNIEFEDEVKKNSVGIGIGHLEFTLKILKSAISYNYSNPGLMFKLNGYETTSFSDYPRINNIQLFSPSFFNFFGFFVNEFYSQENFSYNSNKYGFLTRKKLNFQNNISSISFSITSENNKIEKLNSKTTIGNVNFISYFEDITTGFEITYRKFSLKYDTIEQFSTSNIIPAFYSILNFKIDDVNLNPSFRFDLYKNIYFQPRIFLHYKNLRLASGYYLNYYDFQKAYDINPGLDVEYQNFSIKSDLFYKHYIDSLKDVYGFEILLKNKNEPIWISYGFNSVDKGIFGMSYSKFLYGFQIGSKMRISENYFRIDFRLSKIQFLNNNLLGVYIEVLNLTNNDNLMTTSNNYKIKLLPRTIYFGMFYEF